MSLNLRHDSIFGCSDKGLDNKVLLDPLKEKLYRQLPAFFYSLPRGSLKTATVA